MRMVQRTPKWTIMDCVRNPWQSHHSQKRMVWRVREGYALKTRLTTANLLTCLQLVLGFQMTHVTDWPSEVVRQAEGNWNPTQPDWSMIKRRMSTVTWKGLRVTLELRMTTA